MKKKRVVVGWSCSLPRFAEPDDPLLVVVGEVLVRVERGEDGQIRAVAPPIITYREVDDNE